VKFNAYEETTCGGVAHVAEHDRYNDSYWGNMEASFSALRLPGIQPCAPPDAPPVGWLDAAGCDGLGALSGWSQDPDAPSEPTDVHVYFGGPAGSGAPGIPLSANVHREDLCAAIGSCEHGFLLPAPLSLFDGKDHPVHAYGIDKNGPNNAELSGSPKALNCKLTPSGVRRHVALALGLRFRPELGGSCSALGSSVATAATGAYFGLAQVNGLFDVLLAEALFGHELIVRMPIQSSPMLAWFLAKTRPEENAAASRSPRRATAYLRAVLVEAAWAILGKADGARARTVAAAGGAIRAPARVGRPVATTRALSRAEKRIACRRARRVLGAGRTATRADSAAVGRRGQGGATTSRRSDTRGHAALQAEALVQLVDLRDDDSQVTVAA
jgi:hypothetical protein